MTAPDKKTCFKKIKAQMIKEIFLLSEPNLCFWYADATPKKVEYFEKYFIQCNLHDRDLKTKIHCDQHTLKVSSIV